MANLKNLGVGANLYMQSRGEWPQISANLLISDPPAHAKAWISALEPFGMSRQVWICPTSQRSLGDPDLTKPENLRLDYTPMPFDANPRTPFKWPKQPWFIEHSSVHGNGNLILYTDGTIEEALNIMRKH